MSRKDDWVPAATAVLLVLVFAALAAPTSAQASSHNDRLLQSLGKDLAALKTQVAAIQVQITKQELERELGSPRGQATWLEICCQAQIREMQKLATSASHTVKQLQGIYKQANHRQGLKLSGQMAASVRQLNQGINTLADAKDARTAQVAVNNIGSVVKLLEQNMSEGDPQHSSFAPPPASR